MIKVSKQTHDAIMARRTAKFPPGSGYDLRCDWDCGHCWPEDVDQAMLWNRRAGAAAARGLSVFGPRPESVADEIRRRSR